jgi:hypothetical protein
MLLGNSSVERNSSFFRDLRFISGRLYGILWGITFAILSRSFVARFNEQKDVAGEYGMFIYIRFV